MTNETEQKIKARPSWDIYFARIVEEISSRSTCTRRQIGAIVVNDNHQIVSTGFNGVVRGANHCIDIGCIMVKEDIKSGTGNEICLAVHAEQNALLQAGKNSEGCTLYCNAFPCKICARLTVNTGVSHVVISGSYSDEEGLRILEDAGVKITYIV